MKLFYYLERIDLIHKLVSQERTGSPDEFARRLGISRTRLYEIVDDLKLEGAPIAYSKSYRTFYYRSPFHISISFDIRLLSSDDAQMCNGGENFFERTFFPDAGTVTLYCKLTSC